MLDFLLHPLFIMVYCALAFWAGLRVADKHHERYHHEQEWALTNQYVRLMAAMDADDPGKPYVPKTPAER